MKNINAIKNIKLYSLFTLPLEDHTISFYYLCDKDGFLHHDYLPSLISFSSNGSARVDYYYHHGLLWQEKGPAKISYSKKSSSNVAASEVFYHNKSSLLSSFSLISKDIFKINNKNPLFFIPMLTNTIIYRNKGPSIVYHEVGYENQYYRYGDKLHRDDGPAIIYLNKRKEIIKSEWFLDGAPLEEDEAV